MPALPSMRAIQSFVAAGRAGSFLEAAAQLNLTPSAVSHQIRLLEVDIGEKLFHRIGRNVTLTDIGRRYHHELSEALAIVAQATNDASSRNSVEVLKLSCSPSLASLWLMPRLPTFENEHPSIEVSLQTNNDATRIHDGSVDVDICYGQVPRLGAVAVENFPLETIVVACAPELADGDKPIRQPSDLLSHALIRSEQNIYSWQQWAKDHNLPIDVARGSRFQDSFMSIAAAVEGRGVVLESYMLLRRHVERKVLFLPFGLTGPNLHCHSLTYIRSNLRSRKISAFKSWLELQWAKENEYVEVKFETAQMQE